MVIGDLSYICESLREEFRRMAGKNLLIVGGTGFLGYYLVQSILHWNHYAQGSTIVLTVYAVSYAVFRVG